MSAVCSLSAILAVRENIHSHLGLEESDESFAQIPGRERGAEDILNERERLGAMWKEICELPLRQRTALLLNLRDDQGASALELFPLAGVAALPGIASALEMPARELAQLWNDLPLEDRRIAERLGITRQQVINLRKCARERLSHRLGLGAR